MPKPLIFTRLRKKLTWEFMPIGVVYFPILLYYAYLAIKTRCSTFAVLANPGIPTGGLFGESKYHILKQLKAPFLPKTALLEQPVQQSSILQQMRKLELDFPIVLKPDIGERGDSVEIIRSKEALTEYVQQPIARSLILQEYAAGPAEYGIMYHRMPGEEAGQISSIVVKDFLAVEGDGQSNLHELMLKTERTRYHYDLIIERYQDRLDEVLAEGEKLILSEVGNHARGTTFLNGNHLITPDLHKIFDPIAKEIHEFYFGRFDIRAESFEAVLGGEFKVMEVNGTGSEPAHIYQPGFSIRQAYKDLFAHWRTLHQVACKNLERGLKAPTFWQVHREFVLYKEKMGK